MLTMATTALRCLCGDCVPGLFIWGPGLLSLFEHIEGEKLRLQRRNQRLFAIVHLVAKGGVGIVEGAELLP